MPQTITTPHANATKAMNRFGWADLSSTDDAAGAEFYSSVLGWSYDEAPIGEGMVHRDAKIGDLKLAGIDPVMPGSGMPTAWTNFVLVEDIKATFAKAIELGAKSAMEPMDVMGEGWMAVLLDPQGAAFGLWQSGRHTGADAWNQPGAYSWIELATDDLDGAKKFYAELFGWNWTRMDGTGDFDYWLVDNGADMFAGAYTKMDNMGDWPSNWAPYFGVADIDAAASDITSAGGNVHVGPKQMGPGKGIGAMDPQGGWFFVIQMDDWS